VVYDCLILVEITVLMAALVTYYSTVCSHWRAAVILEMLEIASAACWRWQWMWRRALTFGSWL